MSLEIVENALTKQKIRVKVTSFGTSNWSLRFYGQNGQS
jgi:hypothetical protein